MEANSVSDELVYLNNDREPASLFRFDGTQASVTLDGVRDFFADDDDGLYALTESDELYVTSDLDTWTLLGTAPNTARSLAVWDGKLYLGTTESTILVANIPEPSTALGCVRPHSAAWRLPAQQLFCTSEKTAVWTRELARAVNQVTC